MSRRRNKLGTIGVFLIVFAVVFSIMIVIATGNFKTTDQKYCEQFGDIAIQQIPARCFQYFN